MKHLVSLSLRNRSLIALVTVVAIIFGTIATVSLKKELFPSFNVPQALVISQYPGAAPEAVEREVTDPLESALAGVQSVDEVSSSSSTGNSQITVETKYGTSSDDVVRELQRAVSQVESELPDGVTPTVIAGSVDDFPVLVMSVSGDDVEKLSKDLEDIAVPEIKKIDGVRDASVSGQKQKQVEIRVKSERMEDKGVQLDELAQILKANGVPVSAGELKASNGAAPVEVGKRLTSVDDIKNLYVTGEEDGEPKPVKVGDVADIELKNEPTTSISRSNGKDALTLQVLKKPDSNTVEVAEGVKDALPELEKKIGNNVEFTTVFDQSPFINQSIEDLVREGGLGLIFAVLVILVFLLSFRATAITAISIPLSLLITMIAIWRTGYSLNMLTLAALTMSIGRVVDDSIVVIESIRRRQTLGGTKFANIFAAVSEVAGAITSSTLTTVAVFIPLAFITGQTGELFRPFALTTSIALLSSLLVSLTIVPVLAYWFLRARESRVKLTRADKQEIRSLRKENLAQWKKERKESRKRARAGGTGPRRATSEMPVIGKAAASVLGEDEGSAAEVDELASLKSPVTRLQKTYTPVVGWATRHPVVTIVVSVVLLVGTLAMTPLLKTEFLGDTGEDTVQAQQTFEPGVGLEEAGKQAEKVEEVLSKTPGVESYQFSIGDSGLSFGSDGGGLSGDYFINLEEGANTSDVSADIQKRFDELKGVGELEVMSASAGPGGDSIDLTLTSNDTKALEDGVKKLTEELKDVDGVQTVTNDLQAVQPIVQVTVDAKKAKEKGLTEAQVGEYVQRAVEGQDIGDLIIDSSTRSVKLFDGSADTVKKLQELEIPYTEQTVQASPVPGMPGTPTTEEKTVELSEIAKVEEVKTAPVIRHSGGLRSAQVSVTPSGDNLGQVVQAVNNKVDETELPSGVSQSTSGVGAEQADAFKQMGLAMLAAILIVFVILVATFKSLIQPLILLVSIPFAATGSIGLLLLTDTPLGLASLIGLLMLIGVVVTNAIVLIDLINHFRAHGVDLRTAVINGARLRYRPIIMTAAATIFALMPMALGLTGGGGVFISKPLAMVVIGGLVSSTLLTLILVPVLYQLIEGFKERRREKKIIKEMARSSVIDKAEARSES